MNIMKIENNVETVIKKASEIIRGGGVVILPFDTVYGFACDPRNEKALLKIFELKERMLTKTIGLAVADLNMLASISNLNKEFRAYIKERTPGKYTFLVKANTNARLSGYCVKNEVIGVRIPESDLVLAMIKLSDGIIAQTSANKSGKPNCYSVEDIFSQYMKEELDQIDLIVDGGKIEELGASRIIDLTQNKPKEIDRD